MLLERWSSRSGNGFITHTNIHMPVLKAWNHQATGLRHHEKIGLGKHCNGVVLETYLLCDPLLAYVRKNVCRNDVKMRFREGETCENN